MSNCDKYIFNANNTTNSRQIQSITNSLFLEHILAADHPGEELLAGHLEDGGSRQEGQLGHAGPRRLLKLTN